MLTRILATFFYRNRRLKRLGRGSVIWIVGTAVTVTAGGLVAPYAMKSERSPEISPTAPMENDVGVTVAESDSGSDSSSSVPSAPSLPVKTSEASPIAIPSGGSAPPSDYAKDEEVTTIEVMANGMASVSKPRINIDTTVQPSDETEEMVAGSPAPAESARAPVDRSRVELFYATDRAQIVPWSFEFWYPALLPLFLAILGLAFTTIALIRYQQRLLWGLGAAACLVLCGMAGTKVVVRYQQAHKLDQIGGVVFGGQRNDRQVDDPMNYGRALVTLPPNHQKGKVERPNALLFEYTESPDKHVMLRQMDPLKENEFFYAVDEGVQQARLPSLLIFIHGYNVAFEDALLRTAQISADLEFDGVPMLYSWPSTGRVSGYLTDEENVEWSVAHLENLLIALKRRTQVESIHVIVHSMGNRALLGAVERLTLRYPSEQPMLDQVVLAAPDVDVGQFDTRYRDAIDQASKQVTLYTSAGDKALLASMAVHRGERLGLSTANMRTYLGVDTVDVSEIDTSLLGHSYYGSQETLIKDIRAIIELGEPPLQRSWLKEVAGKAEPVLWRFAEGSTISTVTK